MVGSELVLGIPHLLVQLVQLARLAEMFRPKAEEPDWARRSDLAPAGGC